jgi:hypothetical protein
MATEKSKKMFDFRGEFHKKVKVSLVYNKYGPQAQI